ncbi:hypothetical protein K5I29_01775 [Flavobacterium agricola]|uniref:Uncharacterized protein n=1 Tax=Flavobacterium agricola TaxID=2870839 RepID=A0ABY6M1U2_9FLAO|nr:hypothetical protein [Flavobacterium agricola]UYW01680.1 hypothetical protein K5I29_01775 [Flavobacterium agricola]
MKTIFFIFFALLAINLNAQEIEFKKNKFFVNNSRVSESYVKEEFQNTDIVAYQNYMSYKQKSTFGGILLGIGGGLIVGDLLVGLTTVHDYPGALTYVGLASVVGSIPVLAGRKKKLKKAISTYNESVSNKNAEYSNEVNIIANNRGLGFQISFN